MRLSARRWGKRSGSSIGTKFRSNTTITKFNEFRFFTKVTTLDYNTKQFSGCAYLTELTLPESVASVNGDAMNMDRMSILTCLRLTAPTGSLGNCGRYGSNKKLRIYRAATGYTSGEWQSKLISARGFVLTYID